jgi:hypothetical protein
MPFSDPSSESEKIPPAVLEYIITHIFCPIKLPQDDDYTAESDRALLDVILGSARNFASFLPYNEQDQWGPLLKMLENLAVTTTSRSLKTLTEDIESQVRSVQTGGTSIVVGTQN